MAVIELIGHRRRHDELDQIDTESPGTAQHVGRPLAAIELPAGVVGIHAAVAINRDAHAQLVVHGAVKADLGNCEKVFVAFNRCIAKAAATVGAGHASIG